MSGTRAVEAARRSWRASRRVLTLVAVAVAVAALLAIAGCAGPPSGTPGIRGVVDAQGMPSAGHLTKEATSFLVVGAKGPDSQLDRAMVRVNDKTRIWSRSADGAVVAAQINEIKPGAQVEVWFAGPVAESYPPQVEAQAVVVTPAK